MKKLLIALLLFSAANVSAGNLSALFSYCSFDLPSEKPYIETYLHINGTSARLAKNSKGKLQAKVEVNMVIRKDSSVVYFDKFNMLSPEMDETDSIFRDFIDQHRVGLDRGKYNLELTITDKNSDQNPINLKQEITVDFPTTQASISDIEFLESYQKSNGSDQYTKSGYNVIPYVNSFYPKEFNRLMFYTEIYRTSLFTTDILIRYYISNSDNKRLIENLALVTKQKANDVNVLLSEIPIGGLPSGNYNLNIEVRDRENKVLAFRQSFFQRSNPQTKIQVNNDSLNADLTNTFVTLYTNPDTLAEYIRYLYPISTRLEQEIAKNQIAINNLNTMQQYFYSFWSKRNPETPDVAWENYLAEVEKTNASFTTRNKKGFETERGRVYLQYGAPNIISTSEDPSAYPYEIWQYYKIQLTGQTNRKFVFYTIDRSTNDYRLLHSDARGELQDNAWELKLHSRDQRYGSDIDREKSEDIYGSRTKENFTNPR